MTREIAAVKKSYTKFEGTKSGWDVSIIGAEFEQNTGEAVIVTKEDIWTRYFFFFEDGLYKMFLAFNKDALGGKCFQDFGQSMEGKYGHAKEVYRDDKVKGGVHHVLDHYEWSAGPDRLKLVDRSEFYGVYCLVLFDNEVSHRLAERRKIINPQQRTPTRSSSGHGEGRRRPRRERQHHRPAHGPRHQEARRGRPARRHRRAVAPGKAVSPPR